MNLALTEDDASALMQLADAAVRGHGLQVARQAVRIMDLLDAAASSEPTATTPEDSSDA